jgi:hypothetical protein
MPSDGEPGRAALEAVVALVDLDLRAGPAQHQRQRQAADASSGHDHLVWRGHIGNFM